MRARPPATKAPTPAPILLAALPVIWAGEVAGTVPEPAATPAGGAADVLPPRVTVAGGGAAATWEEVTTTGIVICPPLVAEYVTLLETMVVADGQRDVRVEIV